MALLRARRQAGDPLRRPAIDGRVGQTVAAALTAAGITPSARRGTARRADCSAAWASARTASSHRRPGRTSGPAWRGSPAPRGAQPGLSAKLAAGERCGWLVREAGRSRSWWSAAVPAGSPPPRWRPRRGSGGAGRRAARPGGQYYKQPAGQPPWEDAQFTAGRRLIARANGPGVAFVAGAVWSASLPLQIEVYGPAVRAPSGRDAADCRHRRLRAAFACARLDPAGRDDHRCRADPAAQLRVSAGRRILIAGNGPLNLQVACELQRAGAEIVAVAEAARRPGPWALSHLRRDGERVAGSDCQGRRLSRGCARRFRPLGRRLAAVEAERRPAWRRG